MLTTLYCDASYCQHWNAGGWAIWLRSERGRHVESGPMPDYCVDSNDAELAAIYAGLYRALRIWPNTEVFVVRSDSQVALRWAHKGYDGHRQTTRRLRSRIDHLHQTHEFRIVPKWVKGHRYGTKTDVYLNNRVDEMARAEMVKMREALRP